MTWNHRVIRHVCKAWSGEEAKLEIQEVYYGVDKPRTYYHGKPFMNGENVSELKETLARMQRALKHPILNCKCDARRRP